MVSDNWGKAALISRDNWRNGRSADSMSVVSVLMATWVTKCQPAAAVRATAARTTRAARRAAPSTQRTIRAR